MHNQNKHLHNYKKIRDKIDKVSEKLSSEHKTHMLCRNGCDLCCMDYSILPIEFNYIEQELKKEAFEPEIAATDSDTNRCIFLKDHSCTIYKHRPVICRTHGLPLLFTNDDYEWELSTCELNFRQFDYEKFTPDNTFPQDTFNSKLFMLNTEYISELKDKKYNEFELIPLKQLARNLKNR